jgi:Uma2 family endonuclease
MSSSVVLQEPRWKFTVEDVLGMMRAGILHEDQRVELLEGELFPMSPQDPPHTAAIRRLRAALTRAYGGGYTVDVQAPLRASDHSLPEPDVMVLRGEAAAVALPDLAATCLRIADLVPEA